MKRLSALVLSLCLIIGLTGCSIQKKGVQYYFSAKVIEIHKEYLSLEIFDSGNSSISEGIRVDG